MKKNNKKRFIALFLSMVMVIAMLAGCGKTTETSEVASNGKSEESKKAEDSKAVPLRLVMYGDTTTRRDEYFANEFHDRVLEELNIDLTVEFLPWSEMNGTSVVNMLAAGESFAVEYIVQLADFHSKGYLAPISEDDINTYMPDYLDMRGDNGFENTKYEGEIYTLPIGCTPYSGQHQSVAVRNELLNEVGWDASDIHTYDQFMEAIAAVKEKYPDISVLYGTSSLKHALGEELGGMNFTNAVDKYAVVNENEDGDKVYSYFETELYKNEAKMMEEWVKLGYQQADILTNPGQPAADWEAGNSLCAFGAAVRLVSYGNLSSIPNVDLKLIKFENKTYVKGRDYDWGIAFSANEAENIPYWLQLFNWIYQSQENYNFAVYGVEGKDWEYNEDGTINKLADCMFWEEPIMQASKFAKYPANIPQENIDAYNTFDEGSIESKLNGFVFDSTPVETEKALLSAVLTEYMEPISRGLKSYDEYYDEALSKLKEAGIDAYVAEYQRQFSEWYAAKNK